MGLADCAHLEHGRTGSRQPGDRRVGHGTAAAKSSRLLTLRTSPAVTQALKTEITLAPAGPAINDTDFSVVSPAETRVCVTWLRERFQEMKRIIGLGAVDSALLVSDLEGDS